MANEKLISTIQYKGQNVGTAELVIEDTSNLPSFNITVSDKINGGAASTGSFKQLGEYLFELQTTDSIPTKDNLVYVRVTSADGKLNTTTSWVESPIVAVKDFAISTNGTGYGSYTMPITFFPSLLGFTGTIEFFHDPERLFLIRSFNVSVKALESASLTVKSLRNMMDPTENINTQMGESFFVDVKTFGEVGIKPGVEYKSTWTGLIGGRVIGPSNPWIDYFPTREIAITDYNGRVLGNVTQSTKPNPTDRNPQSMSIIMGELTAPGLLVNHSFVSAYSIYNLSSKFVATNLAPGAGFSIANVDFGTAIGGTEEALPNGTLGSYAITRKSGHSADVEAYYSRKGNTGLVPGPYIGNMTILGWDTTILTDRESRKQFGKFQKVVRKTAPTQVNAPSNVEFTLADFNDTISNEDYGSIGSFLTSDVVLLATTEKESGRCNLYLNAGNFMVNVSAMNVPYVDYTGPVSVLALRKTNGIFNHASSTQYPRVLMANVIPGTRVGANGEWYIDVPANSGIDLSSERYQVQYTHQSRLQGAQIDYMWRDVSLKRAATRITLTSAITLNDPDLMHFAIWDMGPNHVINRFDEGKLRGAYDTTGVSPWTTPDLAGDGLSVDIDVVVTPSFDQSTEYQFSSNIKRLTDIDNLKKFTVQLTNQNGGVYPGKSGLLVWDKRELTSPARRAQFGRYQFSLARSYDGNGDVAVNFSEIVNNAANDAWGPITSFDDPNLLTFFTSEEAFTLKAGIWQPNRITLYSQTNRVRGVTNWLFLRSFGWFAHNDDTPYPRIIYAKHHELGGGTTYKLPLDLQSMSKGGLDERYQAIAMARPLGGTLPRLVPTKLTRSANEWQFDIGSNGTSNRLQIAIVDYGPPVIGHYGDPYQLRTERASTFLNDTYLASRYPVEVANNSTRIYGSFVNSWSTFGRYAASLQEIRASELGSKSGYMDFAFTNSSNTGADDTSEKPVTVFLSINGSAKIAFNRVGGTLTAANQRFACADPNGFFALMRNHVNGLVNYQVTLI